VDDLRLLLAQKSAERSDRDLWRPVLLDPAEEADREHLLRLLGPDAAVTVHDSLAQQLTELMDTRHAGEVLTSMQLELYVRDHLSGRQLSDYGTWVLYPWSRRLVHVLPSSEFLELRTSRNRNKISKEEQQKLRNLRVGIVGLSVGQATALTLAMEGIGGAIRLADFDSVSTSNLNRLRCGLHELGVNKAVITARQLFEVDPYANVEIICDGINDANLDAFLSTPVPLDLLFEQSDSFFFKVRIRERARYFRIPTIMDTNDRGLLDVERFDLEPERPILHGLMGEVTAEDVRLLSAEAKMRLAMMIIGGRPSDRLAASLPDIGRTLKTWPQLASEVSLGAALNVVAARRIALGSFTKSGRFTIDLETILSDPAA
jgi:hypothetical protein